MNIFFAIIDRHFIAAEPPPFNIKRKLKPIFGRICRCIEWDEDYVMEDDPNQKKKQGRKPKRGQKNDADNGDCPCDCKKPGKPEKPGKACCKAFNLKCLKCSTGQSEEFLCEEKPGLAGCKDDKPGKPGKPGKGKPGKN